METKEIRKAIIPIAGLGTRFLPLSLAVPKEFMPMADKTLLQLAIEEVKASGIEEVVFVINAQQKGVAKYLKKSPDLEKFLSDRGKAEQLRDLKEFERLLDGIKFSFVVQKEMAGNANAVLQGSKAVKKDPFAVVFSDDTFHGDEPATAQLATIFKTCNAPVLGLKHVAREDVPAYGMVVAEKIANRLYKIRKITEKPAPADVESTLVSLGRYVLTPEVFDYVKKCKPAGKSKEIALADAFKKMLEEGKTIYGYEVKGEWLECGDKEKWLKSFLYLAIHHPVYGNDLRNYLKTIK